MHLFSQLSACLKISLGFHFSKRQQEPMTGRPKMEETISKILHETNEKLLLNDLIDKTEFLVPSSPQNIIMPSTKTPITSQEASISQMEIGLPELKSRESIKTNLFKKITSALEMLFGEKNRGIFDHVVPEVNNDKNAEKKMLNTKMPIDNMFIYNENMVNDKGSAEKMSNAKNSVGNMFNVMHSVETPFNENIFNAEDSIENLLNHNVSDENIFNTNEPVENMFNVQYDKLSPQSVKHEETKTCCCPTKDKFSTKLSYRLKKSSDCPHNLPEEDINQVTPPCNCKCSGRNLEGEIKKIIEGLRDRKLKLSVRL